VYAYMTVFIAAEVVICGRPALWYKRVHILLVCMHA